MTRTDWSKVNWEQPTIVIARQCGVTARCVIWQRWRRAPETVGAYRSARPVAPRPPMPPRTDWAKADWRQSNTALASAYGVSREWASRMRAKHAPETLGRRGRKYVDWAAVDWSRSNGELATSLGVNRDVVSRRRGAR